jgi:uncharacterized protein (UPF0216 family)
VAFLSPGKCGNLTIYKVLCYENDLAESFIILVLNRIIMKAIMHMHSTYSDGIRSLKELVDSLDFDIICVTDHAHYLDKKKFKEYVKECKKLSNRNRLVVPCLEIGRKQHHVMAIGIENFIDEDEDIEERIRLIKKNNGIAILSHPYGHKDKKISMSKDFLDKLKELDGVEIWNTASHGKKIPSAKAIKFFNKLKNDKLIAVCGADMHATIQKEPYFLIDCELNKKSFLDALRKGKYKFYHGKFMINSSGEFFIGSVKVNEKKSFKIKTWLNVLWLWLFGIPISIGKFICDFLGFSKETKKKLSIFYSRFFGKGH